MGREKRDINANRRTLAIERIYTYKVNPSGSGNSTHLLQLLSVPFITHRQKKMYAYYMYTHTEHTRTLVSRRIIRISEIYKRQMQQID